MLEVCSSLAHCSGMPCRCQVEQSGFRAFKICSLTDLYQDPMLAVRLLAEIFIDTLQLKLDAIISSLLKN